MPTTQTQTNIPWQPAQSFIKSGLQGAKNLWESGAGFRAPSFDTYVPFSDPTQQSLNQVGWLSGQGNPLAGQSMGAISGILSGNINNRYNDLYAQNNQDYVGLANKYNQLYTQTGNPYYEKAVQQQADKTAADVQRQFGGLGRIGSAADTGALVDQIGQMRTAAMANHWDQNVANQRSILSDQSGLYSNFVGNQGNLLSGQTTGQLNAIGAAPGAYGQQYLPAERLGQVGAAYDDRAQRQLQSQIDKFNTNQQAGWNRLGAFNQNIGATGGTSPGFATQQVSKPTNWLGILSGAGLGAASLLSGGDGGGGGGSSDLLKYLMGGG